MDPWIIIVLLGLSVIVYGRIFFKQESQPVQEKLIAEMENTFEHFAVEIEEENKQLLEHVLSLKQQYDGQNSKLLSRVEFLEKQFLQKKAETPQYVIQTKRTKAKKISKASSLKREVQATEMNQEVKQEVPFMLEIKARYPQLFDLHNQGKSMEHISKKLGMNKGEVQLILELAKQEEQSSV